MTTSTRYCFVCMLALAVASPGSFAQTVTLTFRPPTGAVVEVRKTRMIGTFTTRTKQKQVDVEKSVLLMGFEAVQEGYDVVQVVTNMTRTRDGKPFENPAHKFLIGRTNTFAVSSDGDLVRLKGQENFVAELKALFPTNAHAELERNLSAEQLYVREKEDWDRSIKRFVGKTLTEGDVWKEPVSFPTVAHTAFQASRVEKIETTGPETNITIVTFISSDRAEIERLDASRITMAEGMKFSVPDAERPHILKIAHRRVFEANTMLPIHNERVRSSAERRSEEWVLIGEHQVESYRRLR